ncbi:hypothetical protein TNIN_376721 [Trichonephila inaurata madagascariensis]|uniref:Uncharacterized protein n=1 Tax=Trichonephila inaurata madagascariensis TaxID=2747483 RepID=A0A8X6X9D2_9ARAC|nr:hypothetical protein TNIN_376721 [Trichonephila inaurata madagascariensis]
MLWIAGCGQRSCSLYPEPEWLKIYTNGSHVEQRINAEAGVFFRLFSVYNPISHFVSAYDGEVEVLRIAVTQLQCRTEHFSTAAILSDPKAALLAINSTLALQSTSIVIGFSCLEDIASIGRWPLRDPK